MVKNAVSAVVAAVVCLIMGAAGCARSTSPGEDGHVLLLLDLDPAKVNASIGNTVGNLGWVSQVVRISYRVGSEEPVDVLVTWSKASAERLKEAGYGTGLLEVPVDREFDLVGTSVPGGTEVFVQIADFSRSDSRTFVVNGNVRLRLRMLDPELPGERSGWVLERLL
jgi:hypothetical protein